MKKINILFLLISFFLTLSCEKEELRPLPQGDLAEKDTSTTDPAAPVISYLALGDSYTIGESVPAMERYPVLLARALEKEGIEVKGPEIIATTGWTTADLKRGIVSADIENKEYELVSLLIGVNNQYQGRSLEEYQKEFTSLLMQAIDLANGNKDRVFVVSIPDYGYTPFGASRQQEISAEIDSFNAAAKEITTSMGVRYFNITPISRNGLSDPELVADDGLHPSGKMYQQWVDLIKGDVLELLK